MEILLLPLVILLLAKELPMELDPKPQLDLNQAKLLPLAVVLKT